jgi:hypothetical protein
MVAFMSFLLPRHPVQEWPRFVGSFRGGYGDASVEQEDARRVELGLDAFKVVGPRIRYRWKPDAGLTVIG